MVRFRLQSVSWLQSSDLNLPLNLPTAINGTTILTYIGETKLIQAPYYTDRKNRNNSRHSL